MVQGLIMTCLMSSLDGVEPLDEVDGELQEDGQLSQEAEELSNLQSQDGVVFRPADIAVTLLKWNKIRYSFLYFIFFILITTYVALTSVFRRLIIA